MRKTSNLKNQPKTKNQTVNVLYYLNSRNSSHKLNQTIRNFKTQKPQVKSSRIDTSTSYLKKQSIQSQSRKGANSHKSTRKISAQAHTKNIQSSIESRMKKIIHIFNHTLIHKDLEEILLDTHSKFQQFYTLNEERKLRMIYDEFDSHLANIVHSFQEIIGVVVEKLLIDQAKKISQLKFTFDRINANYERELKEMKAKSDHVIGNMEDRIQEIMTRNLIVSETVNFIHQEGVLNFENWTKYALGITEPQPIQQPQFDYQPNNDILSNFI